MLLLYSIDAISFLFSFGPRPVIGWPSATHKFRRYREELVTNELMSLTAPAKDMRVTKGRLGALLLTASASMFS